MISVHFVHGDHDPKQGERFQISGSFYSPDVDDRPPELLEQTGYGPLRPGIVAAAEHVRWIVRKPGIDHAGIAHDIEGLDHAGSRKPSLNFLAAGIQATDRGFRRHPG